MSEARIMLVDDDRSLLDALAERLTADGFDVVKAASGREALARLDRAWPDLVVIDLLMPQMDGEALAAQIKKRADLPIVVLSAIDAKESKAALIERYAEDYVTKPYDYVELVARLRRVLRRIGDQIPVDEVQLGELRIVPRRREAIANGRLVSLSPTESRFLATLAASMPRPVSTEQLLHKVWTDSDAADPAYVWVTVRRLRQKLERDPEKPRHLLTDAGGGYRLAAGDDRPPSEGLPV